MTERLVGSHREDEKIYNIDIILRIKVVQNSNSKPREVVSPFTHMSQLREMTPLGDLQEGHMH